MELTITVHNLDLTTRLQNYVEHKTARLDRYMPRLADITVELSTYQTRSASDRQVAQITIRDERGTILRAEERSNDIFGAVDAVVDKLYRQIKRYRGKKVARRRSGLGPEILEELEPVPISDELDEEEDEEPAIVRTKRFTMRPMPTDEAIEQMELLGHDFYVFYNADDEAVNVVYRRHDGNYGLLQPDIQ